MNRKGEEVWKGREKEYGVLLSKEKVGLTFE